MSRIDDLMHQADHYATAQMSLVGPTYHGVGDALDRAYTPQPLADAVVELLATTHLSTVPGRVIEPSVGGGAFVRAAKKRWGERPIIHGYDVDPKAAGLDLSNGIVADWATVGLDWVAPSADTLVLGNPPFGAALDHVRVALALGVTVALVLPLDRLERASWLPLWERHPLAGLHCLRPRPWPDRVQGTALFVWRPEVTTEGHTLIRPLVWS